MSKKLIDGIKILIAVIVIIFFIYSLSYNNYTEMASNGESFSFAYILALLFAVLGGILIGIIFKDFFNKQ